jgi:hypothetical protein
MIMLSGAEPSGGGLVDAEAQAARRVVDGVSPLDGRRVTGRRGQPQGRRRSARVDRMAVPPLSTRSAPPQSSTTRVGHADEKHDPIVVSGFY